jgi:hypothetical protein
VLPQLHLPPLQPSLAEHCLLHAPQWLGSFCRLAQPLPQQVSPVEQICPLQLQAPSLQVSGAGQAWPQLPQLASSLARFLHVALPQQTSGEAQTPLPQGHVPVVEQLADAPLTQHKGVAPVHAAPLPQPHLPATQDSPGLHA